MMHMTVLEALAALGFSGHLRGDEPATEADYVARVAIDDGRPLPPWGDVAARIAARRNDAMRDLVRAEASRRMRALVGARDATHLTVVISNAQREAARLHTIRLGIPGLVAGREWTADEAARAAGLYAADQAIEAIRAASNALEGMEPVPDDFTDDGRWPAGPWMQAPGA